MIKQTERSAFPRDGLVQKIAHHPPNEDDMMDPDEADEDLVVPVGTVGQIIESGLSGVLVTWSVAGLNHLVNYSTLRALLSLVAVK